LLVKRQYLSYSKINLLFFCPAELTRTLHQWRWHLAWSSGVDHVHEGAIVDVWSPKIQNFGRACRYPASFTTPLCGLHGDVDLRLEVRIPAMPLLGNYCSRLFTHVPLSPSRIIWYQSQGIDDLLLGK